MKIVDFLCRYATGSESQDAIETMAASWLVRRREGLRPEEEIALRAWLSADPRHPAAFAKLEGACRVLSRPRVTGQVGIVLTELGRHERRRTRRKAFGVATAALGAAAALAIVFVPARVTQPDAIASSTVIRRPNLRTLPDGSILELNAAAEIAVTFTPSKRGVNVIRGAVLFNVTKDVTRPFVVTAGSVDVRAVGTEFLVRHELEQIDVLVTEGTVRVEGPSLAPGDSAMAIGMLPQRSDANPPPPVARDPSSVDGTSAEVKNHVGLFLTAGTRATVSLVSAANTEDSTNAPQIVSVTRLEIDQALAWRGQRIEFTGTPLSEAIECFNRQNRLQITIVNPLVREIRIIGIYWADDPEGFVRVLETGSNIKAERAEHAIILR